MSPIALLVLGGTVLPPSCSSVKFSPWETQVEMDDAVQTFGTVIIFQHTEPSRLGTSSRSRCSSPRPSTCLSALCRTTSSPARTSRRYWTSSHGAKFVGVVTAGLKFAHVLLHPTLLNLERHVLGKGGDIKVLR
ncbi:Amino acid/auxin permease [Globisporangium polare]